MKTYLDELENIKESSFDDYKKPEKVSEEQQVEKKVKKKLVVEPEPEKEEDDGSGEE